MTKLGESSSKMGEAMYAAAAAEAQAAGTDAPTADAADDDDVVDAEIVDDEDDKGASDRAPRLGPRGRGLDQLGRRHAG